MHLLKYLFDLNFLLKYLCLLTSFYCFLLNRTITHRACLPILTLRQRATSLFEPNGSTYVFQKTDTGRIIRVYPVRWHMILIFIFAAFLNAFIWICFAPIIPNTELYYNLQEIGLGKFGVDLLSLSYLFLYIPGSIISALLIHKYDLRVCIIVGAGLNFVGSLLRYLSSYYFAWGLPRYAGYAMLLTGQSIAAISQPFFTNMPAKLAGEWFPDNQRDIATVLGSLAAIMGNAAGQVIPSILVTCPTPCASKEDVIGFDTLLLIQLISTGVVSLWALIFFRKEPVHPPTLSAFKRRISRKQSRDQAISPLKQLKDETVALLRQRHFLMLFIGFGMGLGLFNSMLTVLEQVIEPLYANASGYIDLEQAQSDAGMYGGILIGAGTVGAAAAGVTLDLTKLYKPFLKGGFLLSTAAIILFLLFLRPNQTIGLGISSGCMGLFMMPLLPITLECAVESTFPISEEASTGLLMASGNTFGIVFIFVLQYFLGLRRTWDDNPTVLVPSSILIAAIVTLCIPFVFLFNGQYKRLTHEREEKVKSREIESRDDVE